MSDRPSPSTISSPRSRSKPSRCAAASCASGAAVDEVLTRHAYPDAGGQPAGRGLRPGRPGRRQPEVRGPADRPGPGRRARSPMWSPTTTPTGALRGYCRFDPERVAEAERRLRAPGRRHAAGRGRLHHDHRPGPRHGALPGRHADRGRDPGAVRRDLLRPVRADADARAPGGRPGGRRRGAALAGRRPADPEHRRGRRARPDRRGLATGPRPCSRPWARTS